MLTGVELKERIERRQRVLLQESRQNAKSVHVKPCDSNFDYTSITQGSKEGLALILDEINGK
jgi:hypothetical protein